MTDDSNYALTEHRPDSESAPNTPISTTRTIPWWTFGIANIGIILVASVLLWWLLADPEWSPLGSYPQPFTALLFWAIIATVWVVFNCGWTGPARLRQPARGLVGIVVVLAIATAITLLLAYGWGAIDPSFAANRADGAGYTTGQLIVLFAFFFYVAAVINWNHWPWAGRTQQPWTGLAEIGALVVPTLVVYGVLALPGLATWADPATATFSTETLIGWFYSLIVAVVLTGQTWDNAPWTAAGSPARVAVFSVLGNLALGTALFYLLGALAALLVGPANSAALGDGVTQYAAQLGVCWVFWMIAWANVFGNRPTHLARVANLAIRAATTLTLGIVTYLAYYFFLAGTVLHEPAVAATLHGNALGFVDWTILIMLFYVLFLGSVGLPRPHPESAPSTPDAVDAEPVS